MIDCTKVVYGAGINERLLGDFIRKHNVRDKLFSTSLNMQTCKDETRSH